MIITLLCIFLSSQATIFETEEQRDFEIILKDLETLKNNPMDINTANLEDLMKIPYLSSADCLRIVEYRETHGPFNMVQDLLKIPGFDIFIFDKIRPLITISVKPIRIEKFSMRLRLETEIPKQEKSEAYYSKTQCVFNQYTVSLVTEKDPYESSFFDYYVAGLIIDEGKRKFALGKYNLDLGSGVVLSPIGSFFQAADYQMMINERGIIPYTSVLENSGFFGGTLADSLFLKFTLFYSNQKLDGRVDSLGFAHSFDAYGQHTDSASLSHKDKINEEMFGYDVGYRFSNLLISNRFCNCTYDPEFVCNDSFAKFYGAGFWISAIGLKYYGKDFVLFSEWARSFQSRIGGLFGFSGFFSYFDFNLTGKYFPVGFYSPKGVEADDDYIGGTLDIRHQSRLADLGATLAVTNKTEVDSAKYDLRLNFEKALGIVDARIQMRWRYLKGQRDLSGSRVFLHITPLKNIFFDLRFEEKDVYEPDTLDRGIFGALEVGLDFKVVQLRIRYGLFDTDSYDSRVYVYETDLPGIINNRMLYSQGNYGFVYFALRPIEKMRFSFKYSIITKDAETTKQVGCQLDARL